MATSSMNQIKGCNCPLPEWLKWTPMIHTTKSRFGRAEASYIPIQFSSVQNPCWHDVVRGYKGSNIPRMIMTIMEVPINQYTGMKVDHHWSRTTWLVWQHVCRCCCCHVHLQEGTQWIPRSVSLTACCMEFIILAKPGIWFRWCYFMSKWCSIHWLFLHGIPAWPSLWVCKFIIFQTIYLGPMTHKKKGLGVAFTTPRIY